MDHATQQNAALVEQSAAAAESLKVQAAHLVEAVAVFKLANDHHTGPQPSRAAAPATQPAPARPKPATPRALPPKAPAQALPEPDTATAAPGPATAKSDSDDWTTF
jgi:hypothetical protein